MEVNFTTCSLVWRLLGTASWTYKTKTVSEKILVRALLDLQSLQTIIVEIVENVTSKSITNQAKQKNNEWS